MFKITLVNMVSVAFKIEAMEQWCKTILPNILESYEPRNIYKCDESGFFYKSLSNKTFLSKVKGVLLGNCQNIDNPYVQTWVSTANRSKISETKIFQKQCYTAFRA